MLLEISVVCWPDFSASFDFAGYHREPPPRLSGTSGLYSSVEGQQIRLLGNLTYHLADSIDRKNGLEQLRHGLAGSIYRGNNRL